MPELPALFIERLKQLIPPNDFDSCLASFFLPKAVCFRVHHILGNTADTIRNLEQSDYAYTNISGFTDVFTLHDDQKTALTQSALLESGKIYIQNVSSMLPVLALDGSDQDWILDMTAAPGGKTILIADILKNRGRISAVEAVKHRFHRLQSMLKKYSVNNVTCYLKDSKRLWHSCKEKFDKILLDAPCSSESRFRADQPKTYRYWSIKKINEMNRKQKQLLYSAVQCLKPGGEIIYCTCSFAPEENEMVIDHVLKKFPGTLTVSKINEKLVTCGNFSLQKGITHWANRDLNPLVSRAWRILPDTVANGFFLCKLKKTAKEAPDQTLFSE